MTKKQRIALWRRVSQCFDRHEREMIKVAKRERKIGPCQAHAYEIDEDEKRMDIIGQNGNTGEHYEETPNRGNWWGLADDWDTEDEWIETNKLSEYEKKYGQDGTVANNMAMEAIFLHKYVGANYTGRNKEPDATSMEDDPPSAAEDSARVKGSYEI